MSVVTFQSFQDKMRPAFLTLQAKRAKTEHFTEFINYYKAFSAIQFS